MIFDLDGRGYDLTDRRWSIVSAILGVDDYGRHTLVFNMKDGDKRRYFTIRMDDIEKNELCKLLNGRR